MNSFIYNKNIKKKDKVERIPLHLPLIPPQYDDEKDDDNNKKSSNDYVINVNDEFEIDFDINKENVIRERMWVSNIKYNL